MKRNDKCIHCGACTSKCSFLQKYGLDLSGLENRPELAYHCFLCGECHRVCPVEIDGCRISLTLRRQILHEAKDRMLLKDYRIMVLEKKNYLFRNYRHGRHASVFFPGCNFPSLFPENTKKMIALLQKTADIGTVFDCCGKPIAELGMEKEEKLIIDRMEKSFQRLGIKEIITACPNCYFYLKPRLSVHILSIYEKLSQLSLGTPLKAEIIHLFVPCPDRDSQVFLKQLQPFLQGKIKKVEGVQCCGLGGCATKKEPGLSMEFTKTIRQQALPRLYTYCASCTGKLLRDGCQDVYHLLPEIMNVEESIPLGGIHSLFNRVAFSFY